jgi:hypothetical protein
VAVVPDIGGVNQKQEEHFVVVIPDIEGVRNAYLTRYLTKY